MSEFKVVCGNCQSDIAIISDVDGEAAICPICGQRDDFGEAQRVAEEHFLHQMIPDMRESIQPGSTAKKAGQSYRWHAAPLTH